MLGTDSCNDTQPILKCNIWIALLPGQGTVQVSSSIIFLLPSIIGSISPQNSSSTTLPTSSMDPSKTTQEMFLTLVPSPHWASWGKRTHTDADRRKCQKTRSSLVLHVTLSPVIFCLLTYSFQQGEKQPHNIFLYFWNKHTQTNIKFCWLLPLFPKVLS